MHPNQPTPSPVLPAGNRSAPVTGAEAPPPAPAVRRTFAVQLGSTRRCAHQARRIAVRKLADWGWPVESDTSQVMALIVAELCANAVSHGRVPGRDFRLRITAEHPAAPHRATGLVRAEVSDAGTGTPHIPDAPPPPEAASGRGLFLVDALADRWGVAAGEPIGKTVWAELRAGAPAATARTGTESR